MVSAQHVDRAAHGASKIEFVAAGPRDRSPLRALAFLLLGGGAALAAALLGALAVTLGFALQHAHAGGVSLGQAIATLMDVGRSPRGLLSYAYELLVAGVGTLAAAAAALAVAAGLYRRPVRSFLTAAPHFRWRGVVEGFALAFPLVTLAFLAERLMGGRFGAAPLLAPGADLLARLGYVGVSVICLFLAAFAEEAIFRGWLLQQTAAWTRRLAVILAVNGLAFSLAHFDPEVVNFLVRAIMGAGWAWIALRTRGVEFTSGAHLANNLFVALFVAPVTFAAAEPEGGVDYRPALVELALMLALIALVEFRLRRRASRSPARPA